MHHQHSFCARLDFELDGGPNSVTETRTESLPVGPENPHGNAWRTVSRTLATEREAIRDLDITEARSWTVVNNESRNNVGGPVGYRLLPGENTVPFGAPGSPARRRSGFADHHLWVTPVDDAERYPAGEFPYQHPGPDGLPVWTEADRPIEDTDLVVWHTMIHHHVPRPEDWPVMPVARLGFSLKPWGFFAKNPALDVPPTDTNEGSDLGVQLPQLLPKGGFVEVGPELKHAAGAGYRQRRVGGDLRGQLERRVNRAARIGQPTDDAMLGHPLGADELAGEDDLGGDPRRQQARQADQAATGGKQPAAHLGQAEGGVLRRRRGCRSRGRCPPRRRRTRR